MVVILVLLAVAIPAWDSIHKSGQFTQINSQLSTLFTGAFARSQAQATGILFLRARPERYPDPNLLPAEQAAFGFQRAVPIVFAYYDERDPNGEPAKDPSDPRYPAGDGATYPIYFGMQPYARPVEGAAVLDLPEKVWVAPDFFDEPTGRVVPPGSNVTVQIPDAEYDDDVLKKAATPLNQPQDSRLDRFMIVFALGGENIEMQTVVDPNPANASPLNRLVYRPTAASVFDSSASQNQWIDTKNPVSARGVVVYDREGTLARPEGAPRRNYIKTEGKPVFISRFGGTTILGEEK